MIVVKLDFSSHGNLMCLIYLMHPKVFGNTCMAKHWKIKA